MSEGMVRASLMVDEVFEAAFRLRNLINSERSNRNRDAELVIYMRDKFFHDCMREVSGACDASVYEFCSNQRILGYKVFIVHCNDHPNFMVFEKSRKFNAR